MSDYGREFVVRQNGRKFQVCLVEKITGSLIERYEIFDDEDSAEAEAERLDRMGRHYG